MNYVIPGILLDCDLLKMDIDTIESLNKILNKATAFMFRRYLNSPEADNRCIDVIKKYFSKRIESVLIVSDLQDSGITDKLLDIHVKNINPTTANSIIKDVECFLQYESVIMERLYKPSKEDYDNFVKEFSRCAIENIFKLTDVRKRIEANKDIIFDKNAYSSDKQLDFLRRKVDDAHACLKVAQYFKHCNDDCVTGEGAWTF